MSALHTLQLKRMTKSDLITKRRHVTCLAEESDCSVQHGKVLRNAPVQIARVYISFCVAQKKSEKRSHSNCRVYSRTIVLWDTIQ